MIQTIIDSDGRPKITVTCFIPDKTKSGGRYETFSGEVKRIDTANRTMIFYDKDKDISGKIIEIGMIAAIEGKIFDDDI